MRFDRVRAGLSTDDGRLFEDDEGDLPLLYQSNRDQGHAGESPGGWAHPGFRRGDRMKARCKRKELLAAFGMVSGVVPARSPKPILQNVKLVVDPELGTTLMATDLEVGIRHKVYGVTAYEPGSVILPTNKIQSILSTSADAELDIETDGDHLLVNGLYARFRLPSEDPSLYPEVPDFAAA